MAVYHLFLFICQGLFASSLVLEGSSNLFTSLYFSKSLELHQIILFDRPFAEEEEHQPIFLVVPRPFSYQLIFLPFWLLLVFLVRQVFSIQHQTKLVFPQLISNQPLVELIQVMPQGLDQIVVELSQLLLALPLVLLVFVQFSKFLPSQLLSHSSSFLLLPFDSFQLLVLSFLLLLPLRLVTLI